MPTDQSAGAAVDLACEIVPRINRKASPIIPRGGYVIRKTAALVGAFETISSWIT